MALFRYDPEIIERFPAVVGGVIHATGVHNDPTPPRLAGAFHDETLAVRARIGATPLSELPPLAAWRKVFRAFGVDPTQYRSAAEALLRRLTKQGDLASIGTLVDLANLVSIRYALPVAVFDQRGISGGTIVRFARGDERWADLGSSQTEQPEPGEVIFADEADVVSARRWCWRQSAGSAAREDTTEILITVEGHHGTADRDVTRALADLEALLVTYAAPATLRSAVLSAKETALESAAPSPPARRHRNAVASGGAGATKGHVVGRPRRNVDSRMPSELHVPLHSACRRDHMDASVVIGTTLVTPLMEQARESRDLALKLADDLGLKLQPSIVAIACAAMAVEAEVNWQADRYDRAWLDANEKMMPPNKWKAWIKHRNRSISVDLGSGLGLRVVELFQDRNLIVHFRGVPDGKGALTIHQPPDARNSGISAVRAWFTPERARRHVATAEESIALLASLT